MTVYGQELEPIVNPQENIGLWFSNDIGWKWFKAKRVLPLYPGKVHDFGTLDAANSTDWIQLESILEIDEDEISQLRVMPLDDIALSLRMPKTGSQMSHTEQDVYQISKMTMAMNPEINTTEFFVHEDNVPAMRATNITMYEHDLNRISLEGFRFKVEELEKEPEKVTKVSFHGW